MQQTQKRELDTDIMRIIAAFFVVMIHVSSAYGFSYIGLFYDSLARFSVPVFVMISGRFLLAKPLPLRRAAAKCAKMLALMVIWSSFYYGYALITKTAVFDGEEMVQYLLTRPMHLWYLYATAALYLLTPCLQVFCRAADRRELRYALGLTFILGSVVTIFLRGGHAPLLETIVEKTKLDCGLGFIFCYLLGDYWRRYQSPGWVRGCLYALGAAGVAITYYGTLQLSVNQQTNELLFSFFAPNVLVTAAAFYLLVQQLTRRFPPKGARLSAAISSLAGCTFGVYLGHVLLLMLWLPALVEKLARYPLEAVPVISLCIFIPSMAAVWLLRKIPLVRKLVS